MPIGGDLTVNDRFLAIDWGTTNRRVYLLDRAGSVLETFRDDRGVLAVGPGGFADEVAAIRARMGDWPVIAAGMVGSQRGWAVVPYLPCPAGAVQIAGALHAVDDRTWIVPGLSDPRGDVMRGEEVQLLGAVHAGLAPADALLCQPGTHCKWARMADGAVASFSTSMTGEMFALLKQHSLLAEFLGGPVADGPAFRAGVAASADPALLTALFGVRAAALLGLRAVEDSAAHASGLLIGSDVRGAGVTAGSDVYLLADPMLGALYTAAIAQCGGRAHLVDSHAAFVAGIAQIWSLVRDR
ncbi:2-dehydro-3-deoxygalactonokinase [Novosphingobium capsulatum]|uniref:2-dehydro-3-deoxygalactonokinase n=1 Tax=Novosphingobium capsulatum TaxID=13688 RepID=UPI0012ED6659|nr:2-dehydro-3-deoxygalactonokinase [Novosphingobium capsulatum]WQD94574.1 2-dehydro-3-deoxygalactonokinase [Novosphingobium capsulatum]